MNEQELYPQLPEPQGPGAPITPYSAYTGGPVYSPEGILPGSPYNVQKFTYSPTQTTCRNCNTSVITRVSSKIGVMTWVLAGVICLFGGICGCCLIPFFVDAFKDAEHYCPNCNALIGKRGRN